ncbi:glycosyltransferase [Sediminibacterium roseum]|uniref:Glycosyltransferase n=1 Tax=Sediminibacterium roseum TaxID=1978412 RepID=A0ABW9ZPL6_9BACT|nr:glycosyltransferase [Sediminibacterium roseum]NCI49046.1 glycosyltransferase [Sediminibacterium roseum]
MSVVIATLGGDFLQGTITALMQGSLPPAEILICIPTEHAHKTQHLANDVVKNLAIDIRGQVKQRAYGFTQVQNDMVLQLDDDTHVEARSLREMVAVLQKLGKGNAVAPIFYGPHTKTCIHTLQNGLLKNIFDYIVCGAPWGKKKMGVITSIGLNYGVDDKYASTDLVSVGWLPGGCVLAYKDDLVTENYFPFKGKAYCEDILHSFFKKQKGTRLWVATRTRVYTDEPASRLSRAIVDKEIPIRRYYVSLSNGPMWRLFIYETFCKIRSFFYSFTHNTEQ